MSVDHLKNKTDQRQIMAVASGRHSLDGVLWISKTLGTSPTHNIVTRQILGKGTWEGPEGVWVEGKNIPDTDYVFQDGSQTAPDPTFFPTDTNPHTGAVILDTKYPTGVGDADTKATTPVLAKGIFKTEKFPDFDDNGNQVDPADGVTVVVTYADLLSGTPLDTAYFTYTASPARVLAGWMLKYSDIPVSRINWTVWAAWRDYCASLETVDYTSISGFEGVGLSAEYYSGTLFDTLLWTRIDPVLQFLNTTGVPAIGLPPDSFSVKWKGEITAEFTETYTFKTIADNGVKLWVNGVLLIDQWDDIGEHTPGTYTNTIALTAGTFYSIEVWWNEGIANAEFQLFWSSASQAEEIIPQEFLYPEPADQPLYEAHIFFATPTTLDAMIDAVLLVSNSIKQDVDGKYEFYCIEQLVSTFDFQESDYSILLNVSNNTAVSSLSASTADIRVSEEQNVFEANIRDLDSQFLEEPLNPIVYKIQALIDEAGREIYGTPIPLFNMTRWQALKVLRYIASRAVEKDLFLDFRGSARSYKVIAGDVVTVTHGLEGYGAEEFLILEHTDQSPESNADTKTYRAQQWGVY